MSQHHDVILQNDIKCIDLHWITWFTNSFNLWLTLHFLIDWRYHLSSLLTYYFALHCVLLDKELHMKYLGFFKLKLNSLQEAFCTCFLFCQWFSTIHHVWSDGHGLFSWNFSIRFWRQCMSLFASIAVFVSLLLTSDRKSSRCVGADPGFLQRTVLTQPLLRKLFRNSVCQNERIETLSGGVGWSITVQAQH